MAERKKYPTIERLYATTEELTKAQEKARKELGYPAKRSRKFSVAVGKGTPVFVLGSSPKDAVGRSKVKLGIKVEEIDPSRDSNGGVDPEEVLAVVAKTAKLTPQQLDQIRASLAQAKK